MIKTICVVLPDMMLLFAINICITRSRFCWFKYIKNAFTIHHSPPTICILSLLTCHSDNFTNDLLAYCQWFREGVNKIQGGGVTDHF